MNRHYFRIAETTVAFDHSLTSMISIPAALRDFSISLNSSETNSPEYLWSVIEGTDTAKAPVEVEKILFD